MKKEEKINRLEETNTVLTKKNKTLSDRRERMNALICQIVSCFEQKKEDLENLYNDVQKSNTFVSILTIKEVVKNFKNFALEVKNAAEELGIPIESKECTSWRNRVTGTIRRGY